MNRKNILVLGGGFAGLEAAIALAKERFFNVTLISDREYFYIYPTSIWIPTRGNAFADVTVPLEKLAERRNFNLIIDEVVEIIGKENKILLKDNGEKNFDYLIVAIGADKMKPKGVEFTSSICGDPEEALEIQKQLDILIAKGHGKIAMGFGGNPKDPSAVRGGPAFELFFNVHHKLKKLGIRDKFELTFFAPMKNPGARMGENAVSKMKMIFDMMNLKSHYGKKIKEFQKNKVVFEDDSILEADLIVFVPANKGKKNMVNSDLPLSEAGFIEINDGTFFKSVQVVFDDQLENFEDIKKYKIASLRNQISFLSQRVYIFNDTVLKNVAYGSNEKDINKEKVILALKTAEAWDFVEKMEFGLNTVLNEFGTNLSGGQRQRIALARAFYKNSSLIILDEATSSLDNKIEKMVLNNIDKVLKNKILITVAHRQSAIQHSDKLIKFNNGQII